MKNIKSSLKNPFEIPIIIIETIISVTEVMK